MENNTDHLSNIPSELTSLIATHTHPSKIPKLCRASKSILNQCKTPQFWSYYLHEHNLSTSQQKLHELFVELARQGDMEFFSYIWNTDIIINRQVLIKERRSLWESYIVALDVGKLKTAKYIYDINYKWINKRVAQELSIIEPDYDENTNYGDIFMLNHDIIEIVKAGNIELFKELYNPEDGINENNWTEVLAFSPNFKILKN